MEMIEAQWNVKIQINETLIAIQGPFTGVWDPTRSTLLIRYTVKGEGKFVPVFF
jgi:hypothetical protein